MWPGEARKLKANYIISLQHSCSMIVLTSVVRAKLKLKDSFLTFTVCCLNVSIIKPKQKEKKIF